MKAGHMQPKDEAFLSFIYTSDTSEDDVTKSGMDVE